MSSVSGIGYYRQEIPLEEIKPGSLWLVVREYLARDTETDLQLPQMPNTTKGTIVAIGDQARFESGLDVNDTVVYREYMGGRWEFPTRDGLSARVLIMHLDWCHLGIKEN